MRVLCSDGPKGLPPKPGGYFARLGRSEGGTYQRRVPMSFGGSDIAMDLPGSDLASRGIGAPYDANELNWVDREPEPYIDFRDQGPSVTCKGKQQRRGFYPSTCELIDLDDLHFTVHRVSAP